MTYNRRKFLHLSSLGFLASLLPSSAHALGNFIPTVKKGLGISDANNLAKIAKSFFYQKEYQKAEALYLQCISLQPENIQFYDGLESVYGAQGKAIEIVELFKTGLSKNPNKLPFYDRTARSLQQLELGNKKLAILYKNGQNISLLKEAKQLYLTAITKEDKKYLRIGLEKLERKVTEEAQHIDYRSNQVYKATRRAHIKANKKRFHHYSIDELKQELDKLKSKKRTELFTEKDIQNRVYNCCKETRLILSLLVSKHKAQQDFQNAIYYALEWSKISPDQEVIKQLKCLFIKTQDYNAWISFRRELLSQKQNFWNYMGLSKALELADKHQNNSLYLTESLEIYNNLLTPSWRLSGAPHLMVLQKKSKILARLGKLDEAKIIYKDILEKEALRTPSTVLEIVEGYINVLLKANELELAKGIIQSVIHPFELNEIDIPVYVSKHIPTALRASEYQKLSIYYNQYNLYELEQETAGKQVVLSKILSIDTENKFAKKRI